MISKDTAMAEKTNKVTQMVLKVDLECSKCYKKVKGILCKFPQIQDQVYDEANNTVTIKVVCCSPEKIRDEICYKGRGTIKSIDIFKKKVAILDFSKQTATKMVLKVDLECSKCYKKVKRILCKFPQIQDQVYDEKNNTVRIKVVCCSPEKIRDEIRYKGKGSIKSIEIFKPPDPAKPADKPKADPPKPADKPKAADPPKPADKPKADPPKPAEKPKAADPPKPADKPKADPPKPADPPKATKVVTFVDVPKPSAPAPVMAYPPGPGPIGFYCPECSGRSGGGPVRYCDGYCARPVYDSWGGGGYRPYYGSHYSENYFNEDNSQGCTIM